MTSKFHVILTGERRRHFKEVGLALLLKLCSSARELALIVAVFVSLCLEDVYYFRTELWWF